MGWFDPKRKFNDGEVVIYAHEVKDGQAVTGVLFVIHGAEYRLPTKDETRGANGNGRKHWIYSGHLLTPKLNADGVTLDALVINGGDIPVPEAKLYSVPYMVRKPK